MDTTEGSKERNLDSTLPNRLIGVTVTKTATRTIYESVMKEVLKNNYELVLHDSLMMADRDELYQRGYDAALMGLEGDLSSNETWLDGYDDAMGDLKLMSPREAGGALYHAKLRWKERKKARIEQYWGEDD